MIGLFDISSLVTKVTQRLHYPLINFDLSSYHYRCSAVGSNRSDFYLTPYSKATANIVKLEQKISTTLDNSLALFLVDNTVFQICRAYS